MEFPKKEDIEEAAAYTHESDHCLSTANENVDNQGLISESIQPSSNTMSTEIILSNEQNKNVTDDVRYTEISSEALDTKEHLSNLTESTINDTELDRNSNSGILEQAEIVSEGTVSEVTHVTQKYQEHASVSQKVVGGDQSSEYVSEYVLESQSENMYISDAQNVNLDSSERVHSKIVVLDDSRVNTSDQVYEQNTVVSTGSNENRESALHQADNESWPQVNQTNGDQLEKDNIKDEYENLSADTNFDNATEIEDQSTTGEIGVQENSSNEITAGKVTENLEDTSKHTSGLTAPYVVKQETNSMEVDESHSVANKEQEGNDTTHTIASIEDEQVVCSNDEIINNVDLVNVSTISSENMSVEGYTIAEGMEVTEIQEGEYTIVEGPSSLDISTNQLDEHVDSDETWVLLESHENSDDVGLDAVSDERNEEYLNELRNQAESRQSVSSQSSDSKPRRGRKPTCDIPMHVLGHDISKPVESVANGRAMPKPRLGVKVPYRNLTSQIVTKAEIEKEVMDRARLKQEQAKSRADIIFARKLTQRLARKIAPSPDPPRKFPDSKKSKDSNAQPQTNETETASNERQEVESNPSQDNSKIHNDSDLLAILEGEGDEMPVLPKEVPQAQVDDSSLKSLEREIALQQLHDLPHQAPKHRIYRGRQIKSDAPILTPEASISKTKTSDKSNAETRQTSTSNENSTVKSKDNQSVHILSDKENETKKQGKDAQTLSPKRDQTTETLSSPKKQPVEIEPQVKVNMVLKTYSRKRKTIEMPEAFMDSPLPKKTMLAESDIKLEKPDSPVTTSVYVTKSSRVIKRKVIWDPDETPVRSPKSVAKLDSQSSKISSVKTVKSIDKGSNLEKVQEKKSVSEKIAKEKLSEKKNSEKSPQKKVEPSPSEKKMTTAKSDTKSKVQVKNKKVRSEVDKLLMDEGAVKMLYDLKNNDESGPRKKKDVYSVEKAHKEIMKKANEIKSDLQQNTSNESPKSLRKKDSFTPSPVKPAQITYNSERKMSKDSTRSSVHTPPGSPAYSFPHSQSSMLVRRRSSSSISSSDEIHENEVSKISRKKSSTDAPKSKKFKKSESNKQTEMSQVIKQPSQKPVEPAENKLSSYKSFTVKKMSKHVTIDLNYDNEKCYCSGQMLEELTTALTKFSKEKDCHVVCITSSSKAFCLGLDYSSLLSDQEDIRKEIATELAEKVREFLLCLLKFPKVLIAGIQGDCVGLGVTMLPLFDMVIASDAATFSTSYANLGCVAEAGFLLSPPIFTNHGLAAELLYNTQQLTADDAFRRGLVTRLCWPEKYNETLKNIVISVSKGSKQSLVATKKQLRRHLVQTTEAAINSETKILVDHWISVECQKNFATLNGGTIE